VSPYVLALTVLENLLFVAAAVVVGEGALRLLARASVMLDVGRTDEEELSITRVGAALLVGLGLLGYLGVILGLARIFYTPVLLTFLVGAVVLGGRTCARYGS
jgi:hypothetical protein